MPGQTQSKLARTPITLLRASGEFIAGPWALRPLSFGIIAAFLNQFSDVRAAVSLGKAPIRAWLESFPSSIAIGVTLGLSFWVIALIIRRCTTQRSRQISYHLGIFILAFGFALAYGYLFGRPLADAPFNTLRVYVVILTVSIIFGVGEQRVARQATRAENALDEVDRQRSLLLRADEDTRREVADFLHDRVQAGLVVANMELNKVSEKLSDQHKAEIRSIIAELEEIRRFDVRDASRLLSPDLNVVGLNQSISELAGRYRSSMKILTQLDTAMSEVSNEKQLAVYRICEQGLLNAAIHGKADRCVLRTTVTSKTTVTIHLDNNGHPLREPHLGAGSGTAVIDAWVSKFSGTWTLKNTDDGQVSLTATLNDPR
jgi:two-component system sensor histidine kinase UhpB